MAKNKTIPTRGPATEYLASLEDEKQRATSTALDEMMRTATGKPAVMWGPSIVGYGHLTYAYDSGRSGEWFEAGFSPRKGKISLYLVSGLDALADLLGNLGKYKTGKSCLYIRELADVDPEVLRSVIERSVTLTRAGHYRL